MLDLLDRILDRLEEWIVCVLIAAATCITFVAVVHRYGASNSVVLAGWAKAHGLTWLDLAAEQVYVSLTAINLSWAQELATYMFVWMAKFGARRLRRCAPASMSGSMSSSSSCHRKPASP